MVLEQLKKEQEPTDATARGDARPTKNATCTDNVAVVSLLPAWTQKARAWPGQLSPAFILELFAWRVVAGFLSVSFFLKGGALLTMGWIFLLQLRHLIYIWTVAN